MQELERNVRWLKDQLSNAESEIRTEGYPYVAGRVIALCRMAIKYLEESDPCYGLQVEEFSQLFKNQQKLSYKDIIDREA